MQWDFRFSPDLGMVSVKAVGDLDYDAMLEFIAQSVAAMEAHAVDRILIDFREAVLRLSPTRLYRLPAVGVAHGLDRRRKVAVVLSPSTARDDEVRAYSELMHVNRLPHLVFGDPDAAIAWLLERRQDEP